MATMDVKDAAGDTKAIQLPSAPGRGAAADSRPVVLSTEDKAALDAIGTALGVRADPAAADTDTTAVSGISLWKQISKSAQEVSTKLSASLTVAAHAVTQSGSWVLSAGTAWIGKVTLGDGTNEVKVRPGSSPAVVGDDALVVTMRPDSLDDIFGQKVTVDASTTKTLGTAGALGDYLSHVVIIPLAANAGAVTLKDGAGAARTIYAGGSETPLPSLVPFTYGAGFYSDAGAFEITAGANVEVFAVGRFTDA